LHLCEALNDREHPGLLDAFEAWRAAEPVGLEVLWPGE
jgi:hypothetical protein